MKFDICMYLWSGSRWTTKQFNTIFFGATYRGIARNMKISDVDSHAWLLTVESRKNKLKFVQGIDLEQLIRKKSINWGNPQPEWIEKPQNFLILL